MIRTMLFAGAMLGVAATSTAQVPVAPATETVAPSPAPTGAVLPAAPPVQLVAPKYKTEIVCRTSVETGSLIAKRKICVTRKQWQYINDENERVARSTVANSVGGQSGN